MNEVNLSCRTEGNITANKSTPGNQQNVSEPRHLFKISIRYLLKIAIRHLLKMAVRHSQKIDYL
jgi:hypothetical protein